MTEETSAFDDLLAGPNSVKEHTLRSGKIFHARGGTRKQRNTINDKYTSGKNTMDAVASTLWYLAANSDGTRAFGDDAKKDFRAFADELDYDVASEMALLIMKQSSELPKDELSLDDKIGEKLKNSKAQTEASTT